MEYTQFRIATRGLVVHNDALLFVSDDGKHWYLPGGRLECGESLPRCVEREIFEETGFMVKAGSLRYVLECLDKKDYIHKLYFYFQTEIIVPNFSLEWQDSGGTVQSRRFFTLNEIKENETLLPRFLAEGEWCSCSSTKECDTQNAINHSILKDNKLPVYQGTVIVKGFELLQDPKGIC